MPDCRIDWTGLTVADWEARFARIRRSTLLQHFSYAQANGQVNRLGARHGIISIDGEEAGIVQMGAAGIMGGLIQAVHLDRGPLWHDGHGNAEEFRAFLDALLREFPRRFGRKIRLLPEQPDRPEFRKALADAGFTRRVGVPGYQTIWIDLARDTDRLRAGLKGKWRNVLARAERQKLDVESDWTGLESAAFLKAYEADRAEKQYDGPSIKLLLSLVRHMLPRKEVLVISARNGGEIIASILVLLHGKSATYQAGWTTEAGRKLGAHHRLLWEAVVQLKDRGMTDFDLGGVNDESAAGVKQFKEGMGGETVQLVGLYR